MNELARRPLPSMTEDEFLQWEGDGSGRKFHLVDGEPVPLPAASVVHGIMQANLSFLIISAVEASGARLQVVSEGAIIPGLSRQDNVLIPDLVVAPERGERGVVAVDEPVLLIEILSPGNSSVTRDNVRSYATLQSVREIVVFAFTRMEAEVYLRTPAGWTHRPEVVAPGGRLRLPGIGLDCPLERVYARTWLTRPRA